MKNDNEGCAITVITAIIVVALVIFLEPLIILKGWNMVAVAHFNAPILTYWEVFWGTLAVNCLIPHSTTTNRKD